MYKIKVVRMEFVGEVGTGEFIRTDNVIEVDTDEIAGEITLPDGEVLPLGASWEDKEGHTYDCYYNDDESKVYTSLEGYFRR